MTRTESQREFRYRFHERIGHLVGSGDPTPTDKAQAHAEAEAAVRAIEKQEVLEEVAKEFSI
jgi:uncharacterized protein (UPF0297 family)